MEEKYIRDKFIRINDERHQRQSLLEKKQLLEKQQMMLDAQNELLYTRLMEEEKDFEQLEQMTFSSIVNDMLEAKVEKLIKEEEELYVLRLQYKKLQDEKRRIYDAIFNIQERLKAFGPIEDEYEAFLNEIVSAQQEDASTSEKNQEIHAMFNQVYEYEKEKIAMNDVVIEGEWLITEVNLAKEHLEKAKLFWEKSAEGNSLSAIKEYKYVDEAQNTINKIQWGLRKFHNALNRIKLYNDEEVIHFLSMPDEWIRKAFQESTFGNVIESFMSSLNLLAAEIIDINNKLRQEIEQEDEKVEGMQHRIERILREN